MSIKKQIASLSKLNAIYGEFPKVFSTKLTLIVIFTIKSWTALTDNRIVRVIKGSNMKFFAFKRFQFCNLKNQQRLILEEVSVSLKDL